jgi:hypothetical protein
MLLFVVILFVVILLIGIIFWTEKLSLTNDSLLLLEERLTKLEKDAVKITFQSKPNPKQFDGIKSEEPFVKTRTKRKPKTTKDWEDEFDLGGNQ